MKRPITSTEPVIKNLPTNKSPGPYGFTGGFYQALRKRLTPILFKLFQKTVEKGMLSCSFYKTTFTLIPKSDKDITHTQKENHKPISLMNINAKIINKMLPNRI